MPGSGEWEDFKTFSTSSVNTQRYHTWVLLHIDEDDDRVYGVRLCLWTADTKGPIVYPQIIYEHGEPCWKDIGNWFVHQSCLAILQSYSSKLGWTGRNKLWIWRCEVSLFILRSDFLHAVKSYDVGPTALLPLRRKACRGFLSTLKIHRPRPGLKCGRWVQWQAR
jgi:hypothetical protein